ncbi:MAG: phosphoadenylyl-sulfate reductase [Magnetococcales bacterium]|nr:phosphoadenylyl-sulfate reductase [Magnetococcales bacterium]
MSVSSLPKYDFIQHQDEYINKEYGHLDGVELLNVVLKELFVGRVAATTSFGTESAVLLAMIAKVDKHTPVIFIDTGKHFSLTHDYRQQLTQFLGLSNIQVVAPKAENIDRLDPKGDLNQRDADLCCNLRKVEPLDRVITGYDAWITGRKRYHGDERTKLQSIETVNGQSKINPLAGWGKTEIDRAFAQWKLPRHPLEKRGFPSVGCQPCTNAASCGGGLRDGRWRGSNKTECGIHKPRSNRVIPLIVK